MGGNEDSQACSNKFTVLEHASVTGKWLVVANRTPGNPWGRSFPGAVLLFINKKERIKIQSKKLEDCWASECS